MKGLLSCALTILLLPSITYAYEGFGVCNFGHEKVASVICYGPTVLDGTTVSGDVKVAGPLKASKVLMGPLTINGTANIQQSLVNGSVEVRGYLYASHVSFEKDVTVAAAKLEIDHTLIKGSVTMSSETTKPTIRVECGSRIMGSVTFEGMSGVVQITDDSKVEGKVKNGEIEFIKKKC